MQENIYNYIQIMLLFINGYFISILFIKCGIAEKTAIYYMQKSKGSLKKLVVYIVFTTAILSIFIPNLISMLTILPLINIIKEKLDKNHASIDTALAMSGLYGANTGGTGSVIGSPTYIILIGFLVFNNIEGASKLNFFTWIIWGLPFVIIFSSIACLIIILTQIPSKFRKNKIIIAFEIEKKTYAFEKKGLYLTITTFLFWLLISALNIIDNNLFLLTTLISIFYLIIFIVIIFFYKFYDPKNCIKTKILTFKDCYSNIPKKGFIIIAFVLVLSAVLLFFNLDKILLSSISYILPDGNNIFLLTFILCLFTVFASELINNISILLSILILILPLCVSLNIKPFPILIAVTLSSTASFMSPLATPANALGFGGIKGVSLKKMVVVGFFMDIIGVFLVVLLSLYILPWFYSL